MGAPAHVAKCKLLQRVSTLMSSSVKNFAPCADDLSAVDSILKKVHTSSENSENDPEILLQFIVNLIRALADDRTRLTLLGKFGTTRMNHFLTPAVDPGLADLLGSSG